jgi:4-amino-4-deoxy-L-arabinose transferase-like glycosyltransferase
MLRSPQRDVTAARPLLSWAGPLFRFLPLTLLLVFFVPVLLEASVLPYRSWDALAFGNWSRLIGEHGHLWFPSQLFDSQTSRPLFYVGQGLLWLVFGYHIWLGRWFSALFAVILAVSVALLAGRLAPEGPARALLRSLAVAVAVSSSVLALPAAGGMSDVPLAAMVAVTGVLLWSSALGRARAPLLALAASAAVLAKPSAYVGLLGLGLALLLELRRKERRLPAFEGFFGLAVGAALGLVYDAVMAGKFHESLFTFIGGSRSAYAVSQSSRARWGAVLRAEWLGQEVRLVVLFGLAYAVARALGGSGRLAASVAAPAALVWSIAGPAFADHRTPYPFDHGLSLGLVAWIGLATAIAAAPFVPQPEVIRRLDYAALVLWMLPGAIVWVAYRPEQVRYLSPVWAPVALATGAALASLALGLARLRPLLAVMPVVAASLLVFANIVNIDGLGGSGWRGLLDLGWSGGWGSKAATENYAYGPFSYVVIASRANLGPRDKLVTSDGRLAYFFPGRVDVFYPRSCVDLRGRRVFVLDTSGESADIMTRLYGSSADPLAWLQCASPHVYAVDEQPGVNATFVVGRPPATTPVPAACHIGMTAGQLADAVFADGVTYARAKAIREAAARVGFGLTRIEQTGCNTYRVVVTGVPVNAEKSFSREAAGVGFRVRIVPAVRYPEVPSDVAPMR